MGEQSLPQETPTRQEHLESYLLPLVVLIPPCRGILGKPLTLSGLSFPVHKKAVVTGKTEPGRIVFLAVAWQSFFHVSRAGRDRRHSFKCILLGDPLDTRDGFVNSAKLCPCRTDWLIQIHLPSHGTELAVSCLSVPVHSAATLFHCQGHICCSHLSGATEGQPHHCTMKFYIPISQLPGAHPSPAPPEKSLCMLSVETEAPRSEKIQDLVDLIRGHEHQSGG